MVYAEGNVALAFGLVIGAGLCTCIGSCIVFCSHIANTKLLAASLGASAGVMLYVSFAEIFMVKSVEAFEEAYAGQDNADGQAIRSATYCFFGGMVFIAFLNYIVHCIEKLVERYSSDEEAHATGEDPEQPEALVSTPKGNEEDNMYETGSNGSAVVSTGRQGAQATPVVTDATTGEVIVIPQNAQEIIDRSKHKSLNRMGIMTGIAIAIHNFPEGLATFVAALAEPSAGIALAIAIALHNIPEGVCVAMPVYYATGSKLKGFMWSFLSGITEPIGGLAGYLILSNAMSAIAYAVLFGMVGGMMVYISLRDLLPTAIKYDPEDKVATVSLFLGMVVMAASLLVFTA